MKPDKPAFSETKGALLVAAVLLVVLLALYWPSFSYVLTGDDYQWIQHANIARLHPKNLLADLDTMWRPMVNGSLLLDLLIWDRWPTGYRLSNLLLQALVALVLYGVARRCGLKIAPAAVCAFLWAVSPFTAEPVYQVSSRVETLLMLSWLGILVLWPSHDRTWSRWRLIMIGGLVIAACATKETWVVTPAFVLAAEWGFRRSRWKHALKPVFAIMVPVVLYAILYVILGGTKRNLFQWDIGLLAKIPHQIAAFFYFEDLAPIGFRLSWRGGVALIIVAGLAGWLILRKHSSGVVGLTLLILPTLPTLFIPYLPTRYTAIPYAGFLLLIAGGIAELKSRLDGLRQKALAALTALVVVLVFIASVSTVRKDLYDIGRVSTAHIALLNEAELAVSQFPKDGLVIHVREERDNPLRLIAATPMGIWKLYYPRHLDPYALIDTAALFEWVAERPKWHIQELSRIDSSMATYAPVLIHRHGEFTWLPPASPVDETLAFYRGQGAYVRILMAKSVK